MLCKVCRRIVILVEEARVKVRTMDCGVTTRAVASRLEAQSAMWHIGCERVDMTLQAEEPFLASNQQLAVYASMRGVARCAAFHLYSRMLEHKRTALFDMALRARFPTASA